VQMAFDDPHYDDCSLREIAEICRVSHMLVRDMKAEQNEKVPDETVSSYSNGPVKPRPRKPAPTQAETEAKEFRGALATIKAFPFNGVSAYHRMKLASNIDDLNYCIDWLTEALQAHVAAKHVESVTT